MALRDDYKFSVDQEEAIDAIRDLPGPFFLTGPAGTGKSFIINYLRETQVSCVVTATTGTAAQLIRGRTLHSFAGIIPRKGVVANSGIDRRVRDCRFLIVDECSMMNSSLLEQLYERFERADANPKLLLVGDLFQLPPVDGDMIIDSPLWEDVQILRLQEQHRQEEGEFIAVLNAIRKAQVTPEVTAFIEAHRVDELPDDCTHLMSLKRKVEHRNLQKLADLPGDEVRRPWDWEVLADPYGKADARRARFPEVLIVKDGARVVLLTNHSEGLWVNGSCGEVTEIRDHSIDVELDDGATVTVAAATEELVDGKGNVLVSISQYPMILAWALTIHKAQGMTMERVGVDLDGHFAHGQTYVALSRCRRQEGLYLVGRMPRLRIDPRIIAYAQRLAARRQADEEAAREAVPSDDTE